MTWMASIRLLLRVRLKSFTSQITGSSISRPSFQARRHRRSMTARRATIAYALEHNAMALIDERKANRLCSERFNALHTGCTVDVLMHAAIETALGRIGLAEAVFNALYYGRMRVPAGRHVDWVVNLIGPERAGQCASLPRSVRRVEVL